MIEHSAARREIMLAPGDYYFHSARHHRPPRIGTLLGSCVSITLWHPRLRIGGMCHYLLPNRGKSRGDGLDGRYADEALEWLAGEVRRADTLPREYHAKIIGGGDMFPNHGRAETIGARNAEYGKRLLARHGFDLKGEHLQGIGHRRVIFDVESGLVWLKHQPERKSSLFSGPA